MINLSGQLSVTQVVHSIKSSVEGAKSSIESANERMDNIASSYKK